MEETRKCTNLGCGLSYLQTENSPSACAHHIGPVIFRDTKKGYECCQRIVYDWDEFTAIPGCTTAPHSDVKQQTTFFQSSAASPLTAQVPPAPGVIVKSIEDFDRELAERDQKRLAAASQRPTEPLLTKEGLFICTNYGCNKPFTSEENQEGVCLHHLSGPGFHDVKKFWPCCGQKSWDWDDFMKLVPCAVGLHIPKLRK